uniref:USP domain-containing protein n=1 Tax=Caenorhabditis japonica TaxID=281687 RepID=A0A8R1HXT5_CAEJA
MATASTSQGNEWRFVNQFSANNERTQNPVSCVRFDSHEEILWVGSTTGNVNAYLPTITTNCHKYAGFVASKVSAIHALEPTESAIFSLTDACLRANTRQGIPIAKFTSPSMTKLSALCHIPNSTNFILGGRQQKLITYDYAKEKEIRTTELNENAAVIIRYNGACTFTADESGNVHIKSSKNFETIHSIQAHGERVLDFDVHGNKLITCGISLNSRHKNTDQFMKVYDLRNYRAQAPIGMPISPRFVRFIPSYCDRVCIVYQMPGVPNVPLWSNYMGAIKMFDLESNSNSVTLPIESATITALDFSSNKQFMTMGNEFSVVSLFADRDGAMINNNSATTICAPPPVQPPLSFSIEDQLQSIGAIPLPYPDAPFLSDWPTGYTEILHRRFKPKSSPKKEKTVHYAKQIENPRHNTKLKKHNIVPYILQDPIILERRAEDSSSPVPNQKADQIARLCVSKLYRKPQPPQKIGPRRQDETLETYTWNVIKHLTMLSPCSIHMLANTVVHVVHSLSPLRNIVMRHICPKDWCITCELHFLFTTFAAQITTDITTTNLAWALARNGVQMNRGNLFTALPQIINAVFNDLAAKSREDSVFATSPEPPADSPMTSQLSRLYRCTECGAAQPVESDEQTILTLQYQQIQKATLCQMIEKTLNNEEISVEEKKCFECENTSHMEMKRQIRELSPVLLIDTNTASPGFLEFWRNQIANFERKPPQSVQNVPPSPADAKHCKFGADCNRGDCKFKHGLTNWVEEQSRLLENVDSTEWQHYIPSRIAAQITEGICRFSDISDVPDYDEPSATIYELDAMIDLIGTGYQPATWTHPVTLLRESPISSTEWTLINEQLVSQLHSHEARHLNERWKLPALLVYKKKRFEVEVKVQKIPEELFFVEDSLAAHGAPSKAIRTVDELPKKGELIGLDCEFIKIQTTLLEFNSSEKQKEKKKSPEVFTQMKAIGRASAVNSTGEILIFDDHVLLPDDVEPTNYLTEFSGIVAEDLSATQSSKYLISHKRLLLRILVLHQRGVIFVGHALQNDFGVMNFHCSESQVIDTVYLWKKETDRMLSLRFLALITCGEEIQKAAHDSVIDAQTALKVYRKYQEIIEKDEMSDYLPKIFSFIPAESPNHSASPLVVYTTPIKTLSEDPTAGAPKSI